MIHFSTTLALAATLLLLIPGVAAETVVTCNVDTVHRLSCDTGVISVQAALYGRADAETCSEGIPQSQLADTKCSQEGTVKVLQSRCDGRKACEVSVNVFGTPNPCVGTFKYLQTTFTCLPAIHSVTCEHSLTHLTCDQGLIISVYGATYGRHDQTTCVYGRPASETQNTDCSQPGSSVSQSCNGKNSCIITASNSVFGDPCPGTYKYLEVAYICEFQTTNPETSL
uniref:SUEL-type lectin domain-containing protein n=2 Tax=Gasterosteus aculeatus aculeatus TaxID=481459 RepID=G3NPV0_GASAC